MKQEQDQKLCTNKSMGIDREKTSHDEEKAIEYIIWRKGSQGATTFKRTSFLQGNY